LTVAAIRQRRYAGHGCAFSHANLADFGLLGFFGCLKELDQGANPSRRERPTFVHKGFVASEPGVCFCQFGLGCACSNDLDYQAVVHRPEYGDDRVSIIMADSSSLDTAGLQKPHMRLFTYWRAPL
jgi:hypothetical protein